MEISAERCPQSISAPVPDPSMPCTPIHIPLIKCGSASINGIKRGGAHITTHRAVGKDDRKMDEKGRWRGESPGSVTVTISSAE